MGDARFAAQKRPPATQLHDVATEELRELAPLRARLQEDFALIELVPHRRFAQGGYAVAMLARNRERLGALEFAQKLGVGVSSSLGDERSTTLDTYKTAGGTTFFTFNKGVTASGPRFRYSPQFDYYWGPLGILGEYVDNAQQLRLTRTITVGSKSAKTELVNFPRQTIGNQAWQIAGAYLLTGEDNTYGAVKPRHDFEPFGGGLGAWELVARLDQLLIDRAAFDGKYSYGSPASSAREAFEWAVGLNWYLNQNVKLQTDYSRTSFTWGKSSSHNLPNESVVLSELQLQF